MKTQENRPFQGLYCFRLEDESHIAAAKILEISVQNEHKPHPFSEEACGLTSSKVFKLLEAAGLNRMIWYDGDNVSPILFREAGANLSSPSVPEDYQYYLLTPIDAEDPDDVQINMPVAGVLLLPEDRDELLLRAFGSQSLSIDFGAGPKIVTNNVKRDIIELWPAELSAPRTFSWLPP